MGAKIPYMLASGLIPKIFEKMGDARRPERFTQDFLESKLGYSGGSARSIIPLLKKMEFLGSDGMPTSLYDRFRDEETRGSAIAQGMISAFSELFERNEYVYSVGRDKLTSEVVGATGDAKDDSKTQKIVSTFLTLREMANFEDDDSPQASKGSSQKEEKPVAPLEELPPQFEQDPTSSPPTNVEGHFGLNVGYTINLNLPETTDIEVFNAIFKALREHLVKN